MIVPDARCQTAASIFRISLLCYKNLDNKNVSIILILRLYFTLLARFNAHEPQRDLPAPMIGGWCVAAFVSDV